MDLQIKLISSQETWALRHKVLRPHQSIKDCVYPQDELPTAFHVGAVYKGQVIGIASFHEESFPDLKALKPYRLRGMATDFDFHKKRIGRKVLEKGFEELRARGCDLMWCNAREIAFPFYERLGLSYLGDLFDIPGLGPHKVMYKYLR